MKDSVIQANANLKHQLDLMKSSKQIKLARHDSLI